MPLQERHSVFNARQPAAVDMFAAICIIGDMTLRIQRVSDRHLKPLVDVHPLPSIFVSRHCFHYCDL